MTTPLEQTARREVASATCVCGSPKNQHQSLCRTCILTLPSGLRGELYRAWSDDFLVHYERAKTWLRENTHRLSTPTLFA